MKNALNIGILDRGDPFRGGSPIGRMDAGQGAGRCFLPSDAGCINRVRLNLPSPSSDSSS